ncbi:hypothetical protein D3C79_899720 [compost metagenome]
MAFFGKILLGVLIDSLIYKFRRRSWSTREWRRPQDDIDQTNYIKKNDLREWAIKTSNSSAYKDYERFEENVKEMAFVRFMCQSFIFLSLIGWLMSGDSNPVLIEVISAKIEALVWYQQWPLKLIWLGFLIFYIGMAFRDEGIYRDYVPLREHGISDHNEGYKKNIKGG